MIDLRTDPALLDRLVEVARTYVMTPAERRAQRRSWVRGQTGLTDKQIIAVMPELAEDGHV